MRRRSWTLCSGDLFRALGVVVCDVFWGIIERPNLHEGPGNFNKGIVRHFQNLQVEKSAHTWRHGFDVVVLEMEHLKFASVAEPVDDLEEAVARQPKLCHAL